jgi:DNA-directed RNA polymerase specialized sigma24 family protein
MRSDGEAEYVDYMTVRLPVLRRAAYLLLCGDGHRADDLVQATAMALYRHWERARAADNTDAYVHRVLVRKFLAERRLRWARVRLMSEPPEPSSPHHPVLPRWRQESYQPRPGRAAAGAWRRTDQPSGP